MAGTASVIPTSSSGNTWIDAILWGAHWSSGGATTTISTAIAGQSGEERVDDGHGVPILAAPPLEAEAAAMAAAMQSFEAVCNIDFRMVSAAADADLVWASVDDADAYGGLGWANPPGVGKVSGEPQGLIAINHDAYQPLDGSGFLARGGYDFCSFLHLLGQAVGLAVPHDRDGSMGFPGEEPGFGDHDMNQGIHTMMTYNDGWRTAPHGPSPSAGWGFQAGPMALDIAALQVLYGANTTYRTGDDTYALPGLNQVGNFYSCLWDAGGTDRIQGASNLPNTIDLRPATLQAGAGGGGHVSYAAGIHGGFTIAWGAVIENATGGDLADAITGNGVANVLVGLGGDDVLISLEGNDTLDGGAGDDTLRGGTGNDTLDGGTGIDRLEGGAGDDLYILAAAGDTLIEAVGAGIDEVRAAVSHSLGANFENLLLTGSLALSGTGNALANRITGNAADNILMGLGGDDLLTGLDGNDTLDGGAGDDRLEGGAGDDLYILAAAGDTLIEVAGAGIDEVRAAVSHSLGANFENLLLTGSLALSGTGNALANRIAGNAAGNLLLGLGGADTLEGGAGNDRLDGGAESDLLIGGVGKDTLIGGPGNDRLEGGAGDDHYILAALGDTLIEAAGAGADEVRAAFSHSLGDNVETLVLTGTLALNGKGNAHSNRLTGNAADNVLWGLGGHDTLAGGDGQDWLDGGNGHDLLAGGSGNDTLVGRAGNDRLDGGAGSDRLHGGAGNDTYILATRGDTVVEGAGAGIDEVRAAYGLALGSHLERLVLTGSLAINGSGNALSNRLTGNGSANILKGLDGNDILGGGAGNDTLEGGRGNDLIHGGLGADRLTGGPGNDAFLFTGPSQGADLIADFHNLSGDNDRVHVTAAAFGGGLVAGTTLASGQFRTRTDKLAQDADDRFIFRSTDRTLWFDANGSAPSGSTLIADLQTGAMLTHADILLVG